MKSINRYFVAACLWIFVPYSGLHSQSAAETETAALQSGRSLVTQFMQTYKSILLKTMSSAGAAGAVDVCADTAQRIAFDMGAKHGAVMKRVSTLWRNPANAPDRFEDSVLSVFGRQHTQGLLNEASESFTIVQTDSGAAARYLKPIFIQPVCLSCHGSAAALSDGIKRTLKERYPEDRAVGYAPGDLRGAVSIVIPVR